MATIHMKAGHSSITQNASVSRKQRRKIEWHENQKQYSPINQSKATSRKRKFYLQIIMMIKMSK